MYQILDKIKKEIPKVGSTLTGKVILKEKRRLFVDLENIGTGVILGKEFLEAFDKIKNLKIGDEIVVKIIGAVNEDGFWELSLNKNDREANWQKLKELKESKEILTLQVSGANQGGLLLQYEGIEGFLPVSQLSFDHYPRIEGGDKIKILEELRKLVGQEVKVRILDIDENSEKLIFSEKEAQEEKLLEEISKYKVGDIVSGVISGLADFGAFFRFKDSSLEGLIHVSEITHKHLTNPAEYLKVNQEVKAKIVNINSDRIFLSLKALEPGPWFEAVKNYQKDKVYTGKVIKITPAGALVNFDDEIYGLCHISQFNDDFEQLKQKLEPNQSYKFSVLDIDDRDKKLILGFAGKI